MKNNEHSIPATFLRTVSIFISTYNYVYLTNNYVTSICALLLWIEFMKILKI